MATTTKKNTTAKKTPAKATTARKSMAPKRKGKRQYPLVDVSLPGWDGAFVLPKLDTLPLGISAKLADGDVIALVDFLRENTDKDTADAIDDLGGDEAEDLMEVWAKASGVELGNA